MDNPPDQPCEVIITAPDRAWLQSFVRRLVDDRLAAAGHVDTMHTTYWWAGEINETDEARAVLHTRTAHIDAIAVRTREEHPYEVACVAATPIVAGEPEYLAWITDETACEDQGTRPA